MDRDLAGVCLCFFRFLFTFRKLQNLFRRVPPTGLVQRMVDRILWQSLGQMLMSGRQVVVGDGREQVVQGVKANREWEEQPGQEVVVAVIATVGDMIGHAHFFAVTFKVVVGEKSHLVGGQNGDRQQVHQRDS